MKLAILAGGVGGARFARAASAAYGASSVSVIVNTADDEVFHGLHVSPDLDSIVYALAGENDTARGWGVRDETFRAFEALRRFDPPAWFQLGDRDLGTHLFRTAALASGAPLSEVTRRIAAAFGLGETVLPMTDDPVRTLIDTDAGTLTFQQYHVRERSRPPIARVVYSGASSARPAAGVIEALRQCDLVLIAPSNPVSSIGPILAIAEIRELLASIAKPVVGLSGVRAGAPFRGDADRFLAALGHEVSALGVARIYASILDGWVVDGVDAALVPAIEALGIDVATTDTVLEPLDRGTRVVERCIELARSRSADRSSM